MLGLLAIDPSLRSTGWATIVQTIDGHHQLRHGLIDTTKIKDRATGRPIRGAARREHIAAALLHIAARHDARAIAIEGYAFAATTAHAHELGALGGVIRHELRRHRYPDPVEIPPSSLKLWATGKGNANKDRMLEAARDLADYDLALNQDWHRRAGCRCAGKSNDVADALLLHGLCADACGLGWHHEDQAPWRDHARAAAAITDDLRRRINRLPLTPFANLAQEH